MTGRGAFAVGLMALLVIAASDAGATLIRWSFTGHVTLVNSVPLAAAGVLPNVPITGYFAYESTTPDSSPVTPAAGLYSGAIKSLSANVGSYHLGFDSTRPSAPYDQISVATSGSMVGPAIFTDSPALDSPVAVPTAVLDISLIGGIDVPTDALPLAPPDLASVTTKRFQLRNANASTVAAEFELESLILAPPIPALPPLGAAFLVAVLGGVSVTRSRRRALHDARVD